MRRNLRFLAVGLTVALALAFGASRWASDAPDGLDKVAQDHSMNDAQQPSAVDSSPLAGYSTVGIADRGTSTGVAGAIGVATTFLVATGLGVTASSARRRRDARRLRSAGPQC